MGLGEGCGLQTTLTDGCKVGGVKPAKATVSPRALKQAGTGLVVSAGHSISSGDPAAMRLGLGPSQGPGVGESQRALGKDSGSGSQPGRHRV